MSDRTQSSVRTGAAVGDAAERGDAAADESAPVSATQAIPTTGSQRAQGEGAGAVPVVPQPLPGTTASNKASASGSGGASSAAAAPQATASTSSAAPTSSVPPTSSAAPGATVPAGSRPAAATGAGRSRPAAGDGPAAASTGSSATSAASGSAARGRTPAQGRGPRRARLQLRHIDTWSALKISLVLSIALFFIWMVAVGLLYGVLSGLGVFTTINDLFGQLGSASGSKGGGEVVTAGVVFGGAAVVGAINIVLLTALCTVGAFIYNLCSDLVGGLEVTLSERD